MDLKKLSLTNMQGFPYRGLIVQYILDKLYRGFLILIREVPLVYSASLVLLCMQVCYNYSTVLSGGDI